MLESSWNVSETTPVRCAYMCETSVKPSKDSLAETVCVNGEVSMAAILDY